jgi:hypothetical protein
VDDASSDETPEVVRKFTQVRHIRLATNRGEGGARNVGIKSSQGKYIAFLDDDDLMLPHRLRVQVPVMETHPEVGVVYGQNIMRGKGLDRIWQDACRAPSGDAFDKTWPDARRAPSGDVFHIFLKEEFLSMDTLLVRRDAFEKAGYFDESLSNMEHYDMFLRLAFHVPFLFVEGNVAINRVNTGGVFYTRLTGQEGYAQMLPKVVEKALAMLPNTAYSRQLRMEVHAALLLRIFCMLERIEEVEGMRCYAKIALRACPWLLTEPQARAALAASAHSFARVPGSPIAVTQVVCEEIKAAATKGGLKDWLRLRLLLADVWMALGMSLGFRSHSRHGEAAFAAARAFLYNPFGLGPTFLRLVVRVVLGARAYNMLSVLKRKVRISQIWLQSLWRRGDSVKG